MDDHRRRRGSPPEAWTVRSAIPGRIRLRHPLLSRSQRAAEHVERVLFETDEVLHASLNPLTGSVLIRHDGRLGVDGLLERLNDGLAAALCGCRGSGLDRSAPRTLDRAGFQLTLSSCSVVLSVCAATSPFLAPASWAMAALAAGHVFYRAFAALFRERKIRVDVLDATVIGLALGYGKTFAGAFMVWAVDVGDVLLAGSMRVSRLRLSEIFGRDVRKARRLVDGAEIEGNVESLQPGDRIVVRSGEQIPVDGVVLWGEAVVDQHVLTGELVPVERATGEDVLAKTLLLAGKIAVEVRRTGGATRAVQIVRIIEGALEQKVRLQSAAEDFADRMVLPTLGLGGLGLALSGPGAMMAVINADFGTGVRIAAPAALLAALSRAARSGILVKNGSILESIHRVDAVIFDKTGTLTAEVPVVAAIVPCDSAFDEDRLLSYAACAEQRFSHPIARAIRRQALQAGVVPPPVDDSHYRVGMGIEVAIDGEQVLVGSRRFLERSGIATAGMAEHLAKLDAAGNSAVFVAVAGRLAGLLELRASPRPETRDLVRRLHEVHGIRDVHLLSGDQEAATRSLADLLGFRHYSAEVLPAEKAAWVRRLQDRGLKVAMVGDGINDAAALSQADYSISLRGAADVATDVADVIFMDGGLTHLELLFEISRDLRRRVERSIWLTAVPNSLCITGALAGVFGLGSSLVLNNVFNLLAIGSTMVPQGDTPLTPPPPPA
ncbi:MAG TPA: heavy metal translocating P-type ATPase [Acidobacteria bacterium]|nr:heavy metal translocating P-type ATPase [Acidobacteriota bacterium]